MCSCLRVSIAIDSLPSDIEALRAFALQVLSERDALGRERDRVVLERDAERAEREKLQGLYEHVRHLLRQANDKAYGSKSEKLEKLPADQLQLALEDLEAGIARDEATEERNILRWRA
jgi:Transposase C of IS166 homeodomain